DPAFCRKRLEGILQLGNELTNEDGEPVFAFRLHQFFAGGGTIYATAEPPAERVFTLRGQRYASAPDGQERLFYPLVFCRECGQEYYAVDWLKAENRLEPASDEEHGDASEPGYWAPDDDLWSEEQEEDLPDHWFE